MRKVYAYIIGGLLWSGAALAQQSLDQQFAALVEEIETWKKEMAQDVATRTSIETLLRQGVAFQKAYTAETDSIVKGDLLDEYVKQRDKTLAKLPVTVFMSYGKETYPYPFTLTFEKDDLEVDAKRPFLFLRKTPNSASLGTAYASSRRMLFSHKEGQRFATMLTRLIAKAKAKEAMSVSLRDFVASVQVPDKADKADNAAVIFLQFKTPTGTVNSEQYRLTEFDAKLLIERIRLTLKASPPPAGYKEPDDLDPATALFAGPAEETPAKVADASAPGAGGVATGSFSFDVARIKVAQGQKYGYYGTDRVLQQFDYRVLFRWGGEQPLNVQVAMYLVSTVNNKLSIVGKSVKEATIEPRRNQELLISAEQKIPGPTAGTVIVQCFSAGKLLKSYSSSAQYKKYADMADIESQIAPLYQNPQYIYPVGR